MLADDLLRLWRGRQAWTPGMRWTPVAPSGLASDGRLLLPGLGVRWTPFAPRGCDDAGLLQRPHGLGVLPELAQDLLVVLAEHGGRAVDPGRRLGELRHEARRADRAGLRVLHLQQEASRLEVRIGQHLGVGVEHAAGEVRLEEGEPVLAVLGNQHGLDDLRQCVHVRHPIGVGGEARVVLSSGSPIARQRCGHWFGVVAPSVM